MMREFYGALPQTLQGFMHERFAGLRPAPCPLFEKSGAKTFVWGNIFDRIRLWISVGAIYPKGTSVGRTISPADEHTLSQNFTFVAWGGNFVKFPYNVSIILCKQTYPRNFLRSAAGRRDVDPYGIPIIKGETKRNSVGMCGKRREQAPALQIPRILSGQGGIPWGCALGGGSKPPPYRYQEF